MYGFIESFGGKITKGGSNTAWCKITEVSEYEKKNKFRAYSEVKDRKAIRGHLVQIVDPMNSKTLGSRGKILYFCFVTPWGTSANSLASINFYDNLWKHKPGASGLPILPESSRPVK